MTVVALTLAACSGQAASTTSAPAASTTTPGASTSAPVASTAAPVEPTTAPAASPAATSDLLTAADVEKVSGLTGIKNVAKGSTTGAGGDVNFVGADGTLVVMANFFDGTQFDTFKNSPNYREALSGLGDAAFVGPSADIMSTLYIVGFKKGDHTAIFATFFKGTNLQETMLTIDQLKALAAIVASRW
jgi:hypothetical protein